MENIAIYTLFDDDYFKYGSTMLWSFFEHNKWFNGDFIIINDNKLCKVSKRNRERLCKISDRIKFLDVDFAKYAILFKNHLTNDKTCNTKQLPCFYKLEIFNNDYEKVLWLDSDMLINGDLSELFTDDKLDGKFCACLDYSASDEPFIKRDEDDYFNGGLYRIDKQVKEKYAYYDMFKMCSTTTKKELSDDKNCRYDGTTFEQDYFNHYIKNEDVLILPSILYGCHPECKDDRCKNGKIFHYYGWRWKPNGVKEDSGEYDWFYAPWHFTNNEVTDILLPKKKMYFYLYVCDDFDNNIAINVHKILLKKYIHLFDELNFVVAVNDPSKVTQVDKAISWLNDICGSKKYNIRIVDNISLRESRIVFEDILPMVEKEENSMVFFGHSKGITDVNMKFRSIESVLRWVIGMYYYAFEYIDETEDKLFTDAMYGSFLTRFVPEHPETKIKTHDVIYCGNFYWLNPRNFKKNLLLNDGVRDSWVYDGYDRFLAENLPLCVDVNSLSSHDNRIAFNIDGDMYHLERDKWEKFLEHYGDSKRVFYFQNDVIYSALNGLDMSESNEDNLDIFVITHKSFDTERTNPVYKIVCSSDNDVTSDKLKVIKVNCELSNAGFSEWQKIYEIFKGNAGSLKKYVGIAHYHRYINFGDDVNYIPNMDEEFKAADCIVTNIIDVPGVFEQYKYVHNEADYLYCGAIIKQLFPDYYDAFLNVSSMGKLIAGNIVIMRREDFLRMCDFMFSVLFAYCSITGIDKTSDESFYKHIEGDERYHKLHKPDDVNFKEQARIPAFLSERLLTVFIYKNFNKFKLYPMRED